MRDELLEQLAVGELSPESDAELARAMDDEESAREALLVYTLPSLIRAGMARPISQKAAKVLAERAWAARKAGQRGKLFRRLLHGSCVAACGALVVWLVLAGLPEPNANQPSSLDAGAPTALEDEHFRIEFDHSKGDIVTLIWKKHDAEDLLSDKWNEANHNGLCRVACSERDFNEAESRNTTVVSWQGGARDFRITYHNPGYGTKELHITWTPDELSIHLGLQLDQEGNHHVGGFLRPFADHGSGRVGTTESKFNFTYPGSSTLLFGGSSADAVYAASKDGDIAVGLHSSRSRTLTIGNGDELDGPAAYFTESGQVTLKVGAEAAVRSALGFK